MDGCCVFFYRNPTSIPSILKSVFGCFQLFFGVVVVPLVLYFILKKLKLVQTIDLKTSKERIWPLLLNSIILGYLSFSVLPEPMCRIALFILRGYDDSGLGMILAFLKFKTSIHMMSTGGAFFFMVLVNLHYGYSFSNALCALYHCNGSHGEFAIAFKCTYRQRTCGRPYCWRVASTFIVNHWL